MKESLAPQFVTSRDRKGMKFMSIVQDAYNKAHLAEDEAQRVNDSRGLSKVIHAYIEAHRGGVYQSTLDFTRSRSGVFERITTIARSFSIDARLALQYAEALPDLKSFVPSDVLPHVDWFAVPNPNAVAVRFFHEVQGERERYCGAVAQLCALLSIDRPHTMLTSHLRPAHYALEAFSALVERQQRSDIILVPMYMKYQYKNMTPEQAQGKFRKGEYGLSSLMGLSHALTNPELCIGMRIDLVGDQSSDPEDKLPFDHVPFMEVVGKRVVYGYRRRDEHRVGFHTATFFVPE